MCLLDNREVRNGWQPLKESVLAIFTKHGAKVLSGRRWDERRLAYAIKGQHRGTYLLVYFAADTQSVAAIRRDLQFREAVLRWLLLECGEVPASAYEPESAFDVNAIPADDAPDVEEPAAAPVVATEAVEPQTEASS
jgi:small subunit ribosomal protein S6